VRRVGLRAGAALLLSMAGACGGPPAPRWLDLAAVEAPGRLPLGALGPGLRLVEEEGTAWLVATLGEDAWRADGPGRFSAEMPVLAVGHPPGDAQPYRLLADGTELVFEPDAERLGREPGRFASSAPRALRLALALAEGAAAPRAAELWACVVFERREGGLTRLRGRRLSGSGFFVPSGAPRTLALELPPDARLTFATALEPLLGRREERTAPRTFRLRLDGAPVFEQRVEPGPLGESLLWHTLELPRGGVKRARLELEVEGPLALSSFLAPVIGPRVTGQPGARPQATRPDLVVFLADTFRADNLAAYGSTLELTPEIDAFARTARVYAHAWSVSTHTLPAHSSIFSGVYPHQNGQIDYHNPLPEAVETLAERLGASGYRCGLLSDGVMVSATHGLDQGFALFDERKEAGTAERVRAFLAADDGRPTFLFLHTYRVHEPYRLGDEEDPRANRAVLARAAEVAGTSEPEADVGRAILMPFMPELRAQYEEGVRDLDRKLGAFLAELEAARYFERGHLLLTSDHGEALGENHDFGHGNHLWEVKLRVPLVLRGPGQAAGTVPFTATLLDVAPTLAELAGIAPDARWVGRSLTTLAEERPAFAWQLGAKSRQVALLAGTRKLITTPDAEALRAGTCAEAFDLGADPGEATNLAHELAWPAELLRQHAEEILAAQLGPKASSVHLSPERVQELQDLGYGGDGPDEEPRAPGPGAPE